MPSMGSPRAPVVLPTKETWDQSAEKIATIRGREPPSAVADDSMASKVALALIAILAAAVAIVTVVGLRRL